MYVKWREGGAVTYVVDAIHTTPAHPPTLAHPHIHTQIHTHTHTLTHRVLLDEGKKKQFTKAIDQEYRVHWIVDNLPVATNFKSELRPDEVYYIRGFPVGGYLDDKHFLFNHMRVS
jgi:hypothetical protein